MSDEGDIVLIYHKDEPGVYGRIEKIRPDIKKDWYKVTITLLTIPHQVITWILRAEYINGQPFTMSGNPMKLVKLERMIPEDNDDSKSSPGQKQKAKKEGKVIPFKKNPDDKSR